MPTSWCGTSSSCARVASHGPRVHVKLDTGMGRLGTKDEAQARAIAGEAAAHGDAELAGLMTHFATADERGDDHFPLQLQRFREFVGSVEGGDAVVHAANSAATLRDPEAHFDMVRCGVAIYGLDPFQQDPADHGLEPALSLQSLRGRGQALRAGGQRRLRAPVDGGRADLGGDSADRLWRWLAPGADQRLRRARPRQAPPAGGHREHGQRDRGPGLRHRRARGRRGGADRRPGRRAHPLRGGGESAAARSTTRSPAACPRG